jgi:hypothetical protein
MAEIDWSGYGGEGVVEGGYSNPNNLFVHTPESVAQLVVAKAAPPAESVVAQIPQGVIPPIALAMRGGGAGVRAPEYYEYDPAAEQMMLRNARDTQSNQLIRALEARSAPETLRQAAQAQEFLDKNPRKQVDWGVESGNWTPGVMAAVQGVIEGWKQGGSPARGLLYAPGAVKAAVDAEQGKLDKEGKDKWEKFSQILGLERGDVESRNAANAFANQALLEKAKAEGLVSEADAEIARTGMTLGQGNAAQKNQFAQRIFGEQSANSRANAATGMTQAKLARHQQLQDMLLQEEAGKIRLSPLQKAMAMSELGMSTKPESLPPAVVTQIMESLPRRMQEQANLPAAAQKSAATLAADEAALARMIQRGGAPTAAVPALTKSPFAK